ncbi:AAA ATPase midasin [Recurvomyces mirabilis]|uniref:Midasin n=1 Tax=Recurvomyces mirabilis TaxID=574656 RepID=A0AAE0TQM1_9PEZI|nr:AAA ATPase midasin [Recurvomyces mirabilis]KAK5150660.1 AAA ATPase midasin [Recurvomyces mirabilis]
MECHWDTALLQRVDDLPPELLQIIQQGSNEQYLQAITKATLDPRYTTLLLAHCENIFAHICSSLRTYGSLAAAVAALGRLVPFAPFLAPYAIRLLKRERYSFDSSESPDADLLYLLGVLRLLNHDPTSFRPHIDLATIHGLLRHQSRPIAYLAIRIQQICLDGADHWFEQTVKRYLGEDTPAGDISGQWDDKVIDYRFLTLWEQERHEAAHELIRSVRSLDAKSTSPTRTLPKDIFLHSTALVGNVLLPREDQSSTTGAYIVVPTITTDQNMNKIAAALKSNQPLLLSGLAGSGKSLLGRHAAARTGKCDEMVTLHLNEQSDAKLLIGVYTTGDSSGSFLWRAGVLTTAVQEGRWVLIEDLDRAPNEIIGTLLPLIERRELLIPSRKQTIRAAPGFRIIATVRSTINHSGAETRPLSHMLGARHWQHVTIDMPPIHEQTQIVQQLHPSLSQFVPQFMAVYERLLSTRLRAVLMGQSKTGVLRAISLRDLLKWCGRVVNFLHQRSSFTSADLDGIFMEAVDCLVGALPDGQARTALVAIIAEELHIDPQRRDFLLADRDVRYEVDKTRISMGRYSLARIQSQRTAAQSTFSTNPHTTRMLERVAAAVVNREPLLLVGETGVGKTTAVQHLAAHLGKKLEPFNLSQQSEAGDLLGGFKPVTARSLIVPIKDDFDDLFRASFSVSKNQQFLELLGKQMAKSNWPAVCKLWHQALKMVDQQRTTSLPSREGGAPSKRRKVESSTVVDFVRWDALAIKLTNLERQLSAGNDAFAFSFVEGNIIKAVRNGDWVLLDEINLASPDTLESIADLLDSASPSILLTEAGNIERIEAHPEFRVFAAMNPATDVGKKDLPPGIRSRFTELYVESPDKDIKSLQSIVRSYLRSEASADVAISLDVSTLYQKILALADQNKLVDGTGQKPHFSLRTLTRTLSYATYIASLCSLRRALYEGFQMSFLTFLDVESARLVQPQLEQHLFGKRLNVRAELQKSLRQPSDGRRYIQPFPGSKHWARQGPLELQDEQQYILTPFIKRNLENLVRASSTRQSPVLIQGPTSSGKTSMIEYLAKRTGHNFVRINNHEHTDLQEYLGTYVSGSDGKLQFQEGVLVNALRKGHWIVLDELNLAPTDVLEALNRLLDDNRELLIPETQETVRPHEDFMLFATQNPAGLYGGRKALSRAFRNRFLELHFDDIPVDELQEILHRRTQLPESRCKRIVSVYRELSVLRQENRLFEQKSFATLRDLFRWALRQNDTIEDLAANGFMLLAERVRKPEEREALKNIIERVMSTSGPRIRIDEDALYAPDNATIQKYDMYASFKGVVWTKAMRRLYVLVSRAIEHDEPVLLVGETGCGKTTVCQVLAEALEQQLHMINAHQNTETGDLIGSQRPVRNRGVNANMLRERILASPPMENQIVDEASSTDVVLASYDEALGALPQSDKQAYVASDLHADITKCRTRFRALFEWVDGSLVQAMREGTLFLLDEISLADDSVLERINSVLESQRSILLAEKGSLDSFITAAPGFQFFATMNPGGDYGKKELSPALRNRFTEIWVPSLSEEEDIVQIVSAKITSNATAYANAMVTFAQWFKRRYNTSASASISVRDILAWVQFVNIYASADIATAIIHGAAMVYIDTLGANPAGLMTLTSASLDEERSACLTQLSLLLRTDAAAIYAAPTSVSQDETSLRIGPFSLPKRGSHEYSDASFTFDAGTTRVNAMRVMRAMQLSKPVMLEGSPGVGKTALVTAIAAAARVSLTRINLSEQSDLLDLFGSDAPVEGAATGTFVWRDAPFLRAMKIGEWVLLDEMNLASQSVLEGLNACLDHRGEVYVPELGQTFIKHPDFKLFAAQNPHHQGGGRKGLPASFVNRFTVVYADVFRSEDLLLICRKSFPRVDESLLVQVVRLVNLMDREIVQRRRFGSSGAPWEFNLRDTMRWLNLHVSTRGLMSAASIRDCVRMVFQQRFRSGLDRDAFDRLFEMVFESPSSASDMFSSISSTDLQLGLALLPRQPTQAQYRDAFSGLCLTPSGLRALEAAMVCVQHGWPIILTGPSGSGKTSMIHSLASATGASVVTLAMNAETDAMDLVGGYEQSDPLRQKTQALSELRKFLSRRALMDTNDRTYMATTLDLLTKVQSDSQNEPTSRLASLAAVQKVLGSDREASSLMDCLLTTTDEVQKASFEWNDGLLVEALERGKWLVLDNANLCSSSVLDRLNGLLEPDGNLIINENTQSDGSPRVIQAHPDFRIFLTVDPRYGELSRAMRNRAVELYLLPGEDETNSTACLQPLHHESSTARFQQLKALAKVKPTADDARELGRVAIDHLGLRDQNLLPRLKQQLQAGLYKTSAVTTSSASLQDSVVNLTDYYRSASSQSKASADLARVQVSPLAFPTLHPLNNQPLVQQNQQLFLHASTLAFKHDYGLRVADFAAQLTTMRASQPLIRQIERAERTALGRQQRGSGQKALLSMGEATVHSLTELIRMWDLTASQDTIIAKRVVTLVCGYWQFLMASIAKGEEAAPLLRPWLSGLRMWLIRMPAERDSVLQDVTSQLGHDLDGLIGVSTSMTGAAALVLWKTFKPSMPASMERLSIIVQFEAIVSDFDAAARQFRQPVKVLARMRLAFAKALRMIQHQDVDTIDITDKLRQLLPDHGSNASQTTQAGVPHFASVFDCIARHFALVAPAQKEFVAEIVSEMEVLALQKTSAGGVATPVHTERPVPRNDLQLLGQVLPDQDLMEDGSPSMPLLIMQHAATTSQVPLRDMHLLEEEIDVLGRAVGGHAHTIILSQLAALNALLHRLLQALLQTLIKTDRADLQSLATTLLNHLEHADVTHVASCESGIPEVKNAGLDVDWLRPTIMVVVDHLRRASDQGCDEYRSSSRAWKAFGLACLVLYIPPEPFDPLLQPLIEQAVYRHCHKSHLQGLTAMNDFRGALSGERDSLRARFLQQDTNLIGSEPSVENICRPTASAVLQLHQEMDTLARAIAPLLQDESVDTVAWKNIARIRSRLTTSYREYGDITGPAIGFVDCLRVAHYLAMQSKFSELSPTITTLKVLVPFCGAESEPWINGRNFLQAFSRTMSHSDTLSALSAFAMRCRCSPLSGNDDALIGAIDQQFQRFYSEWKLQLSDDQKRTAARSSLYRYQGTLNDEDAVSAEELEALFPTADGNAPQTKSTSSDRAATLAHLHGSMFRPGSVAEPASVLQQLRESADWLSAHGNILESRACIPAMTVALQSLKASMSQHETQDNLYNMYTDSNLREMRKAATIVSRVQSRFLQLHHAWPEHATPVEVDRLCDQIYNVPHSEPITKVLPMLEKLHASITQWQQIASREFSVLEMLEEIVSLIVSWRQLELSSWAGLLDREDRTVSRDAQSWWFIAYESIVASGHANEEDHDKMQAHAKSLLAILEVFITKCGLGEFVHRKKMLRDFEAHAALLAQSLSSWDVIRSALQNFNVYFARFEQSILGRLSKGRAQLETDLKMVVQLASWKDRNIDTLRQSASLSHKKLLRYVRKYRNLLAQPVGPMGVEQMSGLDLAQDANATKAVAMPGSAIVSPVISNSKIWSERPARYQNIEATVSLMRSKTAKLAFEDVATRLAAYRVEIKDEISSLLKETPPLLNTETKDHVQDLKRRKRRLLADVIRAVQDMGIAKGLGGDALARQASHSIVFSSIPTFDRSHHNAHVHEGEHTFHLFLNILPAVREAARKHSEDLTSAEAQRCMGLLESMLHTILRQRTRLQHHIGLAIQLRTVLQQLSALATADGPTVMTRSWSRPDLAQRIVITGVMLRSCGQLIATQVGLAGHDPPELLGLLEERARALDNLHAALQDVLTLPAGTCSEAETLIYERLLSVRQRINLDVREISRSDAELEPLLEHLLTWVEPPKTALDTDDREAISIDNWTVTLMRALDAALAAAEACEKTLCAAPTDSDDKSWLVRQHTARQAAMQGLAMPRVLAAIAESLAQLPHLIQVDGSELRNAASMICQVLPILRLYVTVVSRTVNEEALEYHETAALAYQLTASFEQLAQRGFCTPSEKAEGKDDRAGNVEAGTGLGDGEGAEDISKDIGDDEDLSELAQEPQASGQKEDIEDQQDAVDMADQELEGDMGEQPEASENGEGEGDENGTQEDLEEESGSVDDQGPSTLDEKMWDEGQSAEAPEKETEGNRGTSTDDAAVGAEKSNDEKKAQEGEEEGDEVVDQPPDEDDRVAQDQTEQLDPHVGEEQNLELTDDLTVDGKDTIEEADSDVDGEDEDMPGDPDIAEGDTEDRDDLDMDDEGSVVDEARPGEDDGGVEDEKTAEAADSIDEEMERDESEDVLMKEEKEALHADEDIVGEADNGGDPDSSDARPNAAASSAQDDMAEGAAEREENEDASATGPQRSSKTEKFGTGSEDITSKQDQVPYKQIGDVLEEWYRQHRQIEDAQPEVEDARPEPADVDMADSRFEHLLDQDATADTQALGAANADQSTALDENAGLSVNGEDTDLPPLNEKSNEIDQTTKAEEKENQVAPSDMPRADKDSKAFVGEPRNCEMDVDMPDDLPLQEQDHLEDVDQQLVHTHLDADDVDDELTIDQARLLWAEHESSTRNLALVLTEHLRLVLQPTQATKMRGDFRTGKRLNIKRIIPYIASSYKRDKIWMRRSVPSKRSYQIMLAIDDSESMAESESKQLAFETVALVAKAMSMLEVGELSVVGFGEDVKIAHDFSTPFTSEAGAQVYKQFSFAQTRTNVRRLLAESIELFRAARLKAAGSASELWQLQLIISDGVCEDHPSIRQLVRQAHEERIMVVFIVVDAAAQKAEASGGPKQSILDLQTAEFVKDQAGEMRLNMVKYLDTFPFDYYLIVRDVQELPAVLAGALRQWFAEVVESG